MRGGPYAAIALAVLSVSFASIFITWSESPPITIALYRLAFATGIIGATILVRSGALRKPTTLLRIQRRDAALMALIGAILATHFALWISSLKVEGESIASSVVLVTSHPLLVGLLSHYVLRERLNRWMTVGIVLGFAGVVSIALADYAFAGSLLYAYNWALRWVTAPVVSLSLVGEPVGSSLLAWVLLSQVPTVGVGIGAGLALVGIYLTAFGQSSHAPEILTTRDVE